MLQCNTAGTHAGHEMGGHSQVVDATGKVLAAAGADEQVLSIEIDTSAVRRVARVVPRAAATGACHERRARHDARAGQGPCARARRSGLAQHRGRSIDLAHLRGRVVVLDFWTFCCVNCLHVLEELRPARGAFPRR